MKIILTKSLQKLFAKKLLSLASYKSIKECSNPDAFMPGAKLVSSKINEIGNAYQWTDSPECDKETLQEIIDSFETYIVSLSEIVAIKSQDQRQKVINSILKEFVKEEGIKMSDLKKLKPQQAKNFKAFCEITEAVAGFNPAEEKNFEQLLKDITQIVKELKKLL